MCLAVCPVQSPGRRSYQTGGRGRRLREDPGDGDAPPPAGRAGLGLRGTGAPPPSILPV